MVIEFNLETQCASPTVSTMSWRRLTHSEILSYVIAILDEEQSTAHISIELDDFNIIVINKQMPSDIFRVQIANSNQTILLVNQMRVRSLKPNTTYSFRLELDLEYWDYQNLSTSSSFMRLKKPFKLVSETIDCKTPSIEEAFGVEFLTIEGKFKTPLKNPFLIFFPIFNLYFIFKRWINFWKNLRNRDIGRTSSERVLLSARSDSVQLRSLFARIQTLQRSTQLESYANVSKFYKLARQLSIRTYSAEYNLRFHTNCLFAQLYRLHL